MKIYIIATSEVEEGRIKSANMAAGYALKLISNILTIILYLAAAGCFMIIAAMDALEWSAIWRGLLFFIAIGGAAQTIRAALKKKKKGNRYVFIGKERNFKPEVKR